MRLLSLSYWFDPLPGPLGALWPLYALLAGLAALGLAVQAWRARTSAPGARGAALWCAVSLACALVRFADPPLLSARILAPGALAVAALWGVLIPRWPRPATAPLTRLYTALTGTLALGAAPFHPLLYLPFLAILLVTLVMAARLDNWPIPTALAVPLGLLAMQALSSALSQTHRTAVRSGEGESVHSAHSAPASTSVSIDKDTEYASSPPPKGGAKDTEYASSPPPKGGAKDTEYASSPPPKGGAVAPSGGGRGEGRLRLALLAPLLWPALILAARIVFAIAARLGGAPEVSPAEPWASTLDIGDALRAATAHSAIVTALYILQARGLARYTPAVLAGTLGLALAGWAGTAYLTRHTAGVTAGDPFGYTAMAVDLARTGLPLHAYPLDVTARALNLPWQAIVHSGYSAPASDGRAASVWPPGYSVLMALAYRLLGEGGLYAATPLVALVALVSIAWLAWLVVPAAWPRGWRAVAAVCAAGLCATSPEWIVRVLVPMADAAATLFSVLALALAWHATRVATPRARLIVLAGLCFGLAYAMRYTQVLLAPTFGLLAFSLRGWPARLRFYALFGVAACVVAAPDLWYHDLAFGHPLATGSEELQHFALSNVAPVAQALWDALRAPGEFEAWGLALGVLGIGVLAYAHGWRWLALVSGPVLVVLFHLPYHYLRLRDLLPETPLLAIGVVVGAGTLVSVLSARVTRAPVRALMHTVLVGMAVWVLYLRTHTALEMPFSPGFSTFGYLVPGQRVAFDTLAELTEPNAVVAATLNSGPITLYAGRETFRPGEWQYWTPQDGLRFVEALRAQGRPLYVLDDGAELKPVLAVWRTRYTFIPLTRLPVPYFYPGGGSINTDVMLYKLSEVQP